LWTVGLTLSGFLLGNVPLIQRNMSVVLWALVLIPGSVAVASGLRIRTQSL
jgi:membrane-associated protein